jgi:hypothetical protein
VAHVELVTNDIYRVRAPFIRTIPNDPIETPWFAAYYLGETTNGYLFSPILSEYTDVVVREESVEEIEQEIRSRSHERRSLVCQRLRRFGKAHLDGLNNPIK